MKLHLLRPHGVESLCGREVGQILLTMDPDHADCKKCLESYSKNKFWYKNQTEGR